MSRQVILGFLIAPLAPAIVHAFIYKSAMGIVFAGLGFAYPTAILFGIPAYLVFKRLGWLRLWQLAIAGFCIGVLALDIYCYAVGARADMRSTAIYGAYGLLATSTFWLIALRTKGSQHGGA